MTHTHEIVFLSHGGGPMPLLGDRGHEEMVDCLRKIAVKLKRPSAIVVISAHWEENIPTITSGKTPSLIYDYHGFPEESYAIPYPCPGEPVLAEQIYTSLTKADFSARLDEQRGFDHGLFVPLKIMYPEADIPCVQLSLINGLNPAEHINAGKSLRQVDYDNLLIIGSGFSFHNMRAFFSSGSSETEAMNVSFEAWLVETCTSTDIDETERERKLLQWEKAPFARYCHPREEHLLPLHVCYGLTQTACNEHFELQILNKMSSMYLWSRRD
ncbi:MAG: class III extradiol ring-cleavage dioxygenase [Desulfopila sp.]|nr:class III extradiol ring-cleavage dioxygenase [Desulfopila sp.]